MATKKETTKKPAAKKAAAPKKATTAKKSCAKKVEKIVDQTAPQHIGLVRNDSWLEPFEGAIRVEDRTADSERQEETLRLRFRSSLFRTT